MDATYNPRYYFDLRKERKNAKNGESAYTPAVALIAALGAALDWIAAQAGTPENPAGSLTEGRRKLVDNAELIAEMTRAAVTALGFKLFSALPGAAATAVYAPEGVDSGVIVKELKSRFAAVITNGQGEMKGQIFRIAHLGFFDYMDTIALIGALEQVVVAKLPQLGAQFGTGLVAAQKLFAERTTKASNKSSVWVTWRSPLRVAALCPECSCEIPLRPHHARLCMRVASPKLARARRRHCRPWPHSPCPPR